MDDDGLFLFRVGSLFVLDTVEGKILARELVPDYLDVVHTVSEGISSRSFVEYRVPVSHLCSMCIISSTVVYQSLQDPISLTVVSLLKIETVSALKGGKVWHEISMGLQPKRVGEHNDCVHKEI